MDCSTPVFPVRHQLPELAQTHAHWVSDAIQPSHPRRPLLLPSIFPASGSFQMNQFFASSGQSIGVSTSPSVLPVNIQNWFSLGWTDSISLESKGFSRVVFNTTVEKHQVFGIQLSYGPALSSICDYWKKHSFGYTDLCWTFGLFHIFDITNLNAMNNLVPVHL